MKTEKWFRGEFCVGCGNPATTVNQDQRCKKCLSQLTIEAPVQATAIRGNLKRDVIVLGKRIAKRGKLVQCFVRNSSYKPTVLLLDTGKDFVEILRKDVEVLVSTKVKLSPADTAYRYVVPDVEVGRGGCRLESFPLTMKNEI